MSDLMDDCRALLSSELAAKDAEIERLKAVVDAAVQMRECYEGYTYNRATKKYDVPVHDPEILTAFNVAFNDYEEST